MAIVGRLRMEILWRQYVNRLFCWAVGHKWAEDVPFLCGRCFCVDEGKRKEFLAAQWGKS
jgi:hypothetical protein